MIKLLLTITFCTVLANANAQQWQRASLNTDYTLNIDSFENEHIQSSGKSNIEQIQGFPKAFLGNPSFKNMRNLTLADIDGDGIDDIIFVANNKLFAYSYQGLIWEKTLQGTAIYPPSIGDVNGNGFLEIVQVTGGIPASGRIYVVDKDGNDLPAWPVNLNNNWIICAPALSDLNNDGKLEIIVNERDGSAGKTHIFKYDGASLNNNWPVSLDGVPAVTPSVGDVDNDGIKDIVVFSTKTRYVFGLDGQVKSGSPFTTGPQQGYSYQSPILANFDNNNHLQIVGATHGDIPQFFVSHHDNTYYNGWPINVTGNNWTYSTPTVVKINGEWRIFMSRPIGQTPEEMLYAWDINGSMLNGFPIVKAGGLEGFISVADITGDNNFELIFGSNLKDADELGFIHAYKMDGSGEVNGFPLKPKGFTFMNGVSIGDVNGNGKINLVALSYSLNFGTADDSVYINVYELDIPYEKQKVLWGTYKGSNTRTGAMEDIIGSSNSNNVKNKNISIFPNPAFDYVNVDLPQDYEGYIQISVYDILGKSVLSTQILGHKSIRRIDISSLKKGIYLIVLNKNQELLGTDRFSVIR